MLPPDYDYTAAGFDNFLSRSIDQAPQANLNSPAPASQAVRLDAVQMTGAIGDNMRIGKITINGAAGNITANDGSNDFFILGDE